MDHEKNMAFSKILFNDILIPDLVENILKEYEKRTNAVIKIQNHYNKYIYDKNMLEKGYFKLPCGDWTDGKQCMCDICMDY